MTKKDNLTTGTSTCSSYICTEKECIREVMHYVNYYASLSWWGKLFRRYEINGAIFYAKEYYKLTQNNKR